MENKQNIMLQQQIQKWKVSVGVNSYNYVQGLTKLRKSKRIHC